MLCYVFELYFPFNPIFMISCVTIKRWIIWFLFHKEQLRDGNSVKDWQSRVAKDVFWCPSSHPKCCCPCLFIRPRNKWEYVQLERAIKREREMGERVGEWNNAQGWILAMEYAGYACQTILLLWTEKHCTNWWQGTASGFCEQWESDTCRPLWLSITDKYRCIPRKRRKLALSGPCFCQDVLVYCNQGRVI